MLSSKIVGIRTAAMFSQIMHIPKEFLFFEGHIGMPSAGNQPQHFTVLCTAAGYITLVVFLCDLVAAILVFLAE